MGTLWLLVILLLLLLDLKLVIGLDDKVIVGVDHRGKPHPLDGDHLVTSAAPEVGADPKSVPDEQSKHHEHAAAGDHGQHDNGQCTNVNLNKIVSIIHGY